MAVAVGLPAVALAVALSRDGGGAPPSPADANVSTARVVRGDLRTVLSVTGTLTARARPDGSPFVVVDRRRGTITWLPQPGTVIGCGRTIYRVDDRPVLLLCGTLPLYRTLRVGATGRDVAQLRRALGVGRRAASRSRRGDRFTAAMAAALARRQRARGAEPTGVLRPADAVVLPGPLRVAATAAVPGTAARPGARVLEATSDRLEVRVDLTPSQRAQLRIGARARIALPDGAAVPGTVARLGRVAQVGDDAQAAPTFPAFLHLDGRVRGIDRAPVRVEVTTGIVRDVLTVPVTALVGRAGGGFAVEAVRPGGRRALVDVALGRFDAAGGRAQVTGRLTAGTPVMVPSP